MELLRLKKKIFWNLSLGDYGRQRTSTKFHDLVLNIKVSKLPSAWNCCVSSTFLTAESFNKYLENLKLKWFQSM